MVEKPRRRGRDASPSSHSPSGYSSDVEITIGNVRERSPRRRQVFEIEDPATYSLDTRRGDSGSGLVNKCKALYANKDFGNIVLLIALYWLQGIPLGLAHGSIPFLLKEKLSYAQVGLFSLAGYPYSLKLFWSPIVDSLYDRKFGRRKSWIVPIQFVLAIVFWWMGSHIDSLIRNPADNIYEITYLFLAIVFLGATQDIAVDGWALTLLSKENLSYASTCQTVGINCGFFLSFTVFLALNSSEFSNKYIFSTPRDEGFLQLGSYMAFWSLIYVLVTMYLILFKVETQPTDRGDDQEAEYGLVETYQTIWRICKLPHMKLFIIVLFFAKIGFIPNDSITKLKLIEHGLHKEDMALAVLIDFPVQIFFGYYAARWSQGESKMKPWRVAFILRLACAALSMATVHYFPQTGLTNWYFCIVILTKVTSSMASTVQFVGLSAFITQIADPVIGGTYMTLLNTLSNFGGTWPVFFIMRAVDYFTKATCEFPEGSELLAYSCSAQEDRNRCAKDGGTCNVAWDGYYVMSTVCILASMAMYYSFIRPTVLKLERLPDHTWRVSKDYTR
ncbi:hypothetical protein GGI15_001526 [Coemansia interrupta]|uniref:Uncharacterized protein n=1 Tax=Coemansia interrupta TaxID=1126814 RepID=A0A9W8HJF9_9FUNG|nr:hypothetical protein GGI15_001526 [Coemansia interrupta]